MKKILFALALCLLLGGCGWMDGEYASVTPHREQGSQTQQEITDVSSFVQLRTALAQAVENGTQNAVFSMEAFDEEFVDANMAMAIRYAMESNPIGAYAVEDITYEVGVTGGASAVAVTITYNDNKTQIRRIRNVRSMEEAMTLITGALEQCETGVVLRVEDYEPVDFEQLIRDHARTHPDTVMELPQILVTEYPESGTDRVLQVQFTYQNSRESLRSMQSYVQPVFSSAALYVSGEDEQSVRFERLYSFLMERNDYTVETSITPTYSLLRHGVGDSRAFAAVYAAMCGRAGLECQVIAGTRAGEAWYWNIICLDGVYYHVDLIQSHRSGAYRALSDGNMAGYVWDYEAYPVCGVQELS